MTEKTIYNQRHIRPIKIPADRFYAPYATFNVLAQQQARVTLNGNAFKLYNYFSSFSPTYTEFLTRKNIEAATGLKKSSYIAAFKELQEAGYIQKDPAGENDKDYYLFVESGEIIS